MFIKYEAEVSSRVSGGERGVVDFGKLFTETSEEKFSLGGVKELMRLTDFFMPVQFKLSVILTMLFPNRIVSFQEDLFQMRSRRRPGRQQCHQNH